MAIVPTLSYTNANAFLAMSHGFVSEEVVNAAQSYVAAQLIDLQNHHVSVGQQDPNMHWVVYAENEDGRIIGFRYFYFQPGDRFCNLFSCFVDREHRRHGLAAKMITRSIEIAATGGCKTFNVLLSEPTPERDGLFNWYCRFGKANEKLYGLVINYWHQTKRFGDA